MIPIAQLYRDSQRSFVELLRSLDAGDWERSVPCTPGWTVRDVLSHVAGVTDDIANGRVANAATEAWTAAQVERWRDADPEVLIEQWNTQIDGIATLLEQLGESRPSIDCHAHEHDVRHAVGRCGAQSSELIGWMATAVQEAPAGRPVTIAFDDGTRGAVPGEGEPIALSGLSQFEFVRSRLGRRTRDQVAAYDWSQPPGDDVLSAWFAFGPAEQPIVESV